MIIREKELKDCESWVDINVKSWNENLKGVVSDNLLKYITDNRDPRIKNDITNYKKNDCNYVLEVDNKVIGILKIKQSDREDYKDCGEVQVLYLDTCEKGKGYRKAVIGCLCGNPSNELYLHIGGKYVRRNSWNFLGEQYLENVYEYDL